MSHSTDPIQAVALDRGVLKLSGSDRVTFLQGLVTNDVNLATTHHAIYSALLTPQGKFLQDFFLFEQDNEYIIECEKGGVAELKKILTRYKLRADVKIEDATDAHQTYAIFGPDAHKTMNHDPKLGAIKPNQNGVAFTDPRKADLGIRLIVPTGTQLPDGIPTADFDTWDTHRLSLGIPDGTRDMIPDKAIPLESSLDDLHAIAWEKGCYLGQELTARTKYRGEVRKALMKVTCKDGLPEFDAELLKGEKVVGRMRTSCGTLGLALVRLEALDEGQATLTSGDMSVLVQS